MGENCSVTATHSYIFTSCSYYVTQSVQFLHYNFYKHTHICNKLLKRLLIQFTATVTYACRNNALIVVGVDANAISFQVKRKLADFAMFHLILMYIRPAPDPRIYHMRKPLTCGHLQYIAKKMHLQCLQIQCYLYDNKKMFTMELILKGNTNCICIEPRYKTMHIVHCTELQANVYACDFHRWAQENEVI